ncbi:MAG TPA: ShlB/FhaC/HecB family hemolysin secretion/activation protein [Rhodocyclaceae bacterium]|nr:ShlB/FhaC/HecB family hemolysin secretion/activation protein [Rhodocyclaceae bacterium]
MSFSSAHWLVRGRMALLLSLAFNVGHLALAQDETFDVNRYKVVGAQLIPAEEIFRLLAPFSGKNKVFGDIQQALEAIEGAYRTRGYSAVHVVLPEQELSQGVVRMNVIESRVANVTVSGNHHFDVENIRASLVHVKEGTSPMALRISEGIQLANENPAKKVDVVMRVGEQEDTVDMDVKVDDDQPSRFFVTADNTGNARTGKTRLGVAYQHANIFNRDHVATVAYTTSPERAERVDIYSLSYRLPLYALGDSIDVIYGQSDVAAGTTPTVAGPLLFSGSGKVYALRYNMILPRLGEYSSRVIFGFDQREFDNTCTLAGGTCGAGGSDVSVRPLSIAYAGQWAKLGQTTDLALSVARNIPGGPHGRQADFSAVRTGADRDYSVYRVNGSHAFAFAGDWQARGAIGGQYSPYPLVPGEQLGLVGSLAVRGFEERIVARDSGYFANFEIYTPDVLAGTEGNVHGNLRGLAFIDVGRGWDRLPSTAANSAEKVGSTGVGVRYAMGRTASLRLDVARVTDGAENVPAGNWRGHFGLTVGF